jgi:hypothetical protein
VSLCDAAMLLYNFWCCDDALMQQCIGERPGERRPRGVGFCLVSFGDLAPGIDIVQYVYGHVSEAASICTQPIFWPKKLTRFFSERVHKNKGFTKIKFVIFLNIENVRTSGRLNTLSKHFAHLQMRNQGPQIN